MCHLSSHWHGAVSAQVCGVPASVGSLALPTLTCHLLRDTGPLEPVCLAARGGHLGQACWLGKRPGPQALVCRGQRRVYVTGRWSPVCSPAWPRPPARVTRLSVGWWDLTLRALPARQALWPLPSLSVRPCPHLTWGQVIAPSLFHRGTNRNTRNLSKSWGSEGRHGTARDRNGTGSPGLCDPNSAKKMQAVGVHRSRTSWLCHG